MSLLFRILAPTLVGIAAALAAESPPPAAKAPDFGRRVQILPHAPDAPPAASLDADAVTLTPAQKLLYDTLLLVQDESYAEAIPKLEAVIRMDPSLVAAWADLGWCYWRTGRVADAETLWNQLLKLNPESAVPYNLLAQIELDRHNLEAAEARLRKSLELDPSPFEIRYALALALAWQARTFDALPLLQQLIREEPDRVDVRIELARALRATQQYEEAAAQWAQVCAVLPDLPEHRRAYAACLLASGDLDAARREARQAADQDGDSPASLTLLADVAEVADRPEEAIAELQALIDQADDPIARSRLRQRLAANLRRLHDRDPDRFPLDRIIAQCRLALEDDPHYGVMRMFLGELYVMSRRFPEARQVFTEILDRDNPFNYRARRGLMEAAFGLGQFEEARRQMDRLYTGYNAGNPYRYVDRARLAFAAGHYPDAIRHLDQLEREGLRGSVLCLGYGDLAATDWEPGLSSRLFRDQMLTLRRAGFRFLAPDEIERLFALRKEPRVTPALPWPARLARGLRRQFTGRAPQAESLRTLADYTPERLVCVTLDGATRTAFRLAEPVARELDIPLAMHIPSGELPRRDAGIASWDEIRAAAASGLWSFGSLGADAVIPQPASADGGIVNPLANRIWLPDLERMETLHEWTLRLRRELGDSRRRLLDQLGLDPGDVRHIAYPLGDIGQQDGCNVRGPAGPMNVPAAILNEAALAYGVGFIPDPFGYATPRDNPLAYRRHAPGPRDTGEALLRHAFEQHPVFLARRLKAELAALQGRTHQALDLVNQLDRDGYPTDLLRRLRHTVEAGLGGDVFGKKLQPEPAEASGLRLSRPFLGAEAWTAKANRQIDERGVGAFAGLNLTPGLKLEAGFRRVTVKQESVTNEWLQIRRTIPTIDRTTETTIENGVVTRSSMAFTTVQQQDVYSNRTTRARFRSTTQSPALRLSRLFDDGSILGARVGLARFEGDEESGTEPLWGVDHLWKLAPAFTLSTLYQRELVPSGRRPIESDTFSLHSVWKARDDLDLAAYGRFSYYGDTNSLLHLQGSALWTVDPRQTVALGLQAEVTTVDDPSADYWSPYWEQRLYGVIRMTRAFPDSYARAECKLGWAREEARPEDLERWRAIQARGEELGFYAGRKPGTDWEPSLALGGSFRRTFARQWEIGLDGSCSFYADYSDYRIGGVVTFHFR